MGLFTKDEDGALLAEYQTIEGRLRAEEGRAAELEKQRGRLGAQINEHMANNQPAGLEAARLKAEALRATLLGVREEIGRLQGQQARVAGQIATARRERQLSVELGYELPAVAVPDPVAEDEQVREWLIREAELRPQVQRLEAAERDLEPKLAAVAAGLKEKRVAEMVGDAKASEVAALAKQLAGLEADLEKIRADRAAVGPALATLVSRREARERELEGQRHQAIAARYRQHVVDRVLPLMRQLAGEMDTAAVLYEAGRLGGHMATCEWPAPWAQFRPRDEYSAVRLWFKAAIKAGWLPA